jgi:DNA-binding NarL/FixJ family response regulator
VNQLANTAVSGAAPRVAILDDHELLLDALTTWVRLNARDLNVVASVTGWFDLIRSPEFPPDVVIMDYQLREPVSVETRVRTCLAAGAVVVMVSALDSADVRDRILAAGAAAFVPKSHPADEVVEAVRLALTPVDVSAIIASRQHDVHPQDSLFTPAEVEALRLYASGNSPVDIALRMSLPFESVKGYLSRVREHYASEGRPVQSKHELIRRAAEDGYLL